MQGVGVPELLGHSHRLDLLIAENSERALMSTDTMIVHTLDSDKDTEEL